jgi:antirestriction protein ArdC
MRQGQYRGRCALTANPITAMNILGLWASGMERAYAAPLWMTFRQARELGEYVRKGEKGAPVVYANSITRTETDEQTGDDVEVAIPYLKA